MKKALLFATFLLMAFSSFAQFNYKFNYQAVVRNGAGALVPNGSNVALRLSVLENSTTGTVLYSETQTKAVNNNQGLVNLVIGDGTPIIGGDLFSGNFQDLTKTKFLKVEVDPAGGTAYTDMGATQLQFVPYAAHALTATLAENGTQWDNGAASSIAYTFGNVNIGNATPSGNSSLSVEQSTSTDHVVSVIQTTTGGGAYKAAVYGKNNATNGNGIGVYGEHAGSGWALYGRSFSTTGGAGLRAEGATGAFVSSTAANGVAIDLDGYLKVSGSKRTAFKTAQLVSSATNITLAYAGAASADMVFVTPISSSTTMPSWALIWNSSNWVLWTASDDASPSNFPAGTSFNVLVIKQ